MALLLKLPMSMVVLLLLSVHYPVDYQTICKVLSFFLWLPVEFRCENLWKFHPTLSKTLKLSSEGCECAHNKPKTFLSAPNRIGLISRWLNIKCLEIWNVFFSFLLLANSQQQIVHKVLFLYLYSAEYKLFSALGLPFKVFVEVVIFIDLQWLQGLRQS